MAKFCTKCGKELIEGTACSCQAESKTEVATVATSNTDIKESFMDCLKVLKGIFTKPIDTIKEFVTENNFITGIILAVVTAISTGVYKIALLKNMYSATSADSFNANDLSDMISSALSGNSLEAAEPEYLKEFMTTFATNFVEYAVIAIIGYLIITKLLKSTTSLKEVVTAVGISLSVVLVANLLNSILIFIDGEFIGYIRTYVFSFGTILSTLILYGSVKQIAKIDNNKLFLTIASMSVFATAAMDIVDKLLNK